MFEYRDTFPGIKNILELRLPLSIVFPLLKIGQNFQEFASQT